MKFHSLKFLPLLAIFTCCTGQEKNPPRYTALPEGPKVIRNFKAVPMAPDFDTTLVSQYIRSIYQDSKGNMWFGTLANGVAKYDVKTLRYFSHPDSLIANTVHAINEDANGNLWFGTNQGVYKYDGKTFRNYNQKDGLSSLFVGRKSILTDRSGTVWVGTHKGAFRYDPAAEVYRGESFKKFEMLPPIHLEGIMQDKSGNIWFASIDNGVFKYNGISIENFSHIEGLGNNYAGGMAQDKAGNMWFTMRNGICRYDGKSFTEYTAKDGLDGIEFSGIFIEDSGIIWFTGRGSTTRFDPSIPLPDPKAFTVFTPADGLNCCVQSMYQDRSGNMWFGTGQGVYRFDGSRFYQVKQEGPW